MYVPRALSGIHHLLLCGILGAFLLTGAVPAQAVTYAYHSPLSFRWGPAAGSVDHYNVYVSVDGQPFELLEEVDTSACQLLAEEGHTYVLQVEAEDAEGRVGPMSVPSDQIVVYLDGSPDDTDGDGMTNAWETDYGLNPFDPNDSGGDLDGDGITNLEEFNAQTDPTDADSDDDGIPDGEDPYPQDPLNGNGRPVADAGEDLDLDPTVVTLDGSGSHDPDGDLLSFSWTQREGPAVYLSDNHSVSPAFLGKKSGVYVFELVVRDGSVASFPSDVTVTISNVRPAADAGEDVEIVAGTVVVLDGSGSADPNGDPVSFSWTQTSGAPVLLDGVGNPTATFAPDLQGIYVFQLMTFDGHLYSPPDSVQVIVNALDNNVPTADAGQDRTVTAGDTVDLNGLGSSDPDRDALSYAWSQLDGPESVVLEGAATAQARFEAPAAGIYEFQLVVHDGQVASAPDVVTVTVDSLTNRTPVAVVETVDPVEVGDWVLLEGSGSFDPDQDSLTYSWSQTGGPQVMLENRDQATAGFYPVVKGTLTFRLVVQDGEASSAPVSVQVEVLPGDPDTVEPPSPPHPQRQAQSDNDGGGCSVGLAGHAQHEVDATGIGYVLTLFLPALGAMLYQKRTWRRRKRTQE